MKESASHSPIRSLSMLGSQTDRVKRLSGYDKSRHTVPKFFSDRAQAFVGKIAESELAEWGESQFASLRSALGYKRREIRLGLEASSARITTKDFLFEKRIQLLEDDLETCQWTVELLEMRSADLLDLDMFNDAVGPQFTSLRCVFAESVSIEDLVDSVEESEDDQLAVDYPSDCSRCFIRIQDIDATFVFDSQSLEIEFRSSMAPGQMKAAFLAIAESLSEDSQVGPLLSKAFYS